MHKLLFDQNLSYKIITNIEDVFPNSTHVRLLGLERADDLTIWQYAKEHNFHLVTRDHDFNDMSTLYGYPPKVIRINTGNTSTQKLIELLLNKMEIIQEFLDNDTIGFLALD